MKCPKNRKFRKLVSLFLCMVLVLSGNSWSCITAVRAADTVDKSVYHGDGYAITIEILSKWDNGYNANVIIENISEEVIRDWKLVMAGADTVDSIWNAKKLSQEGGICKIDNDGWNQDIAAGSSVSFGFQSFTGTATIPQTCYLTGSRQDAEDKDYQIVFRATDTWKDGCVVEADIINITDRDVVDWDVTFTWKDITITDIWNAVIDTEKDSTYTITNDTYNSIVPAKGTVTFGMRVSTGTNDITFPVNAKLSHGSNDGETATEEELRRWNRTMMHMDADSVQEAVDHVEEPVKVAILDSGVDAMPEIPVVERKNLIPGEDEMTEMYEDATGHGTAVASVMAFHKEKEAETEEEEGYEGYTYEYYTKEIKDIDEYLEYKEPAEEEDATDDNDEENSDMQEEDAKEEESNENALHLGDFIEKNQADFEGINPNMELYSVRVLDEMNESPVSCVIQGIQWAMENDIKILNISFGTENDSAKLHNVIKEAYESGMLIIAAAGNEGEIQYPAAYDEVIAVGSVDYTGKEKDVCESDARVELSAPGEGVLAVGAFGVETEAFGTSIASGEVSAIASILWQQDTSVNNRFIRELLRAGANKNNNTISDYGIVDCEYSLSIFEDLKETFADNEDASTGELMEESGTPENTDELDTVEDIVTANWGGKGHLGLVQENVNNITGDYLNILKIGIRLQDSVLCNLNDKKMFPAWHGYFKSITDKDGNVITSGNYIAGYLYLSRMAKWMYEGQQTNKEGYYSLKNSDYWKKSFKKLEMEGIINNKGINLGKVLDKNKPIIELSEDFPESTWKNIFKCKLYDGNVKKDDIVKSDDNYDHKSILNRSLIVYGMALHTMSDTFAHSCWGYGKYEQKNQKKHWQWGPMGKVSGVDRANDSKSVRPQRYEAARQAVLNSMNHIKIYNNDTPDKYDDDSMVIEATKTLDFSSRRYYLEKTSGQINNEYEDIIDIQDYIHYSGAVYNTDGSENRTMPVAIDMSYYKEGFGVRNLWKYIKQCGDTPDDYFKRIDFDKLLVTSSAFGVVSTKINIPGANDGIRAYVDVGIKKSGNNSVLVLTAEGAQNETVCLGLNKCLKTAGAYKIQYRTFGQTTEMTIDSNTPFNENEEVDEETVNVVSQWSVEANFMGSSQVTLNGLVVEATETGEYGNKVIQGAEVSVQYVNKTNLSKSDKTGSKGKYTISELDPGLYKLTVTKTGYVDVTQYLFLSGNAAQYQNMAIALVKSSKDKGAITGVIRDSVTLEGVSGLSLELRKGFNNTEEGEKIQPDEDKYTMNGGGYSYTELDVGYYCLKIHDDKGIYIDTFLNVIVTKESSRISQDGIVSQNLEARQMRIVLTWDNSVKDLDSHLVNNSGSFFHVYYASKEYMVRDENENFVTCAELDVDDAYYYGPETVTVYDSSLNFRYYVHNYSGGGKGVLSNSNATVRIYIGNNLMETYYVPSGSGYMWDVFSYDGNTGTITTLGTIY